MPTLSNITVKKYDNTTDVVYVAVAAASADGVPAEYQNVSASTIPAARPVLSLSTRSNTKKTSRRVVASYKWPLTYTDPNGRVTTNGSVNGEFSVVIPQDVDPLVVREAHQQFAKLIASAVFKDVMDTGMAPR